jgi:hypothetical protein
MPQLDLYDLTAPAGCHPPIEPAPTTKHLATEIEHKVPQLTGSGPLDA